MSWHLTFANKHVDTEASGVISEQQEICLLSSREMIIIAQLLLLKHTCSVRNYKSQ